MTPACSGGRGRGRESEFPSVISVFIPSFELECAVNYNLVGVLIFPFLSTQIVSHIRRCICNFLGFFLYRLLQNVEYISLCYTVGSGHLFYQQLLFTHSVVTDSL